MGAAAMGAEEEDDEFGGGRDALDHLYSLSRILILFSIVYFYSSLTRLLLVMGAALLVFVYTRAGQARRRMEAEALQRQRDEELRQRQQRQQQEAANRAEGEEGQAAEATTEQEPQVEVTPPVAPPVSPLSLAGNMVFSFFASLLPEQPAAAV